MCVFAGPSQLAFEEQRGADGLSQLAACDAADLRDNDDVDKQQDPVIELSVVN